MVKERLILIGKIALAAIFLWLLVLGIGFFRDTLSVSQIEKIELTACDDEGIGTVELNAYDVRRFVTCYNLSRHAGMVTAEGCTRIFQVTIYLNDGERICIYDHRGARLEVEPSMKEQYWIDNSVLLNLIRQLVDEYGLIWDRWSCC